MKGRTHAGRGDESSRINLWRAAVADLALFDAQRHALAVDVADLQRRHLRDAVIDQLQRVVAQILQAGGVGRAVQKAGELPHGAQTGVLCLGKEFAHPHVVEHALASGMMV